MSPNWKTISAALLSNEEKGKYFDLSSDFSDLANTRNGKEKFYPGVFI